MPHRPLHSRPAGPTAPPLRSALLGVSALVLLGVLAADVAGPRGHQALRDLQRPHEAAVDRAAVRNISASLARAMRELVGSELDAAAVVKAAPALATDPVAATASVVPDRVPGAVPAPLRAELLDLPPPA